MAPRRLLVQALAAWQASGRGVEAQLAAIGGVDALRAIESGARPFDVVVLASDAIDKLDSLGCLAQGTTIGVASARVAMAVKTGAPKADMSSEGGVRQAVLAAERIGYSTGPSGAAILRLFEAWGIDRQLRGRLVQARPGTPVGSLVASGEATLGFQQLSELIRVDGIDVVGVLPPEIEIRTTFSGAVARTSALKEEAKALLAFIASGACDGVRRAEGLDPVTA